MGTHRLHHLMRKKGHSDITIHTHTHTQLQLGQVLQRTLCCVVMDDPGLTCAGMEGGVPGEVICQQKPDGWGVSG